MSDLLCKLITDGNSEDDYCDDMGERMTERVNEWIKENPDIKIQKMNTMLTAAGSNNSKTCYMAVEIWYIEK